MTIPTLVCTEGGLAGHHFEVTEKGLVIGRDAACAVRLDDPNVSRSHARVVLHNSGVWVEDMGSRNGVFINEKRVTGKKTLSPGDLLLVGGHRFTVELMDPDTENSVSVNLGSLELPAPTPPSRTPLLVGAVVGVALLIGVVVLVLRGGF